jgi:hypothetical protein
MPSCKRCACSFWVEVLEAHGAERHRSTPCTARQKVPRQLRVRRVPGCSRLLGTVTRRPRVQQKSTKLPATPRGPYRSGSPTNPPVTTESCPLVMRSVIKAARYGVACETALPQQHSGRRIRPLVDPYRVQSCPVHPSSRQGMCMRVRGPPKRVAAVVLTAVTCRSNYGIAGAHWSIAIRATTSAKGSQGRFGRRIVESHEFMSALNSAFGM